MPEISAGGLCTERVSNRCLLNTPPSLCFMFFLGGSGGSKSVCSCSNLRRYYTNSLMNSSLAGLTRRCVVLSESPRNGRMLHSAVGNHMVKTRKDSCLCAYSSLLFAELVLRLCELLSFVVFFFKNQRFEFPC